MSDNEPFVFPYIPNSVPKTKEMLLKEVGATDIEDLYMDIPRQLRYIGKLDLPKPFLSEHNLRRHVNKILAQNKTSNEYLNLLGAGCYHHFIPAICDEINQRGEFLTAYSGKPYIDHGRFQAIFEYASMMGELLDMDVVNVPTYDGFQAAATALRMACRITKRSVVIITGAINPDKISRIYGYLSPDIKMELIDNNYSNGHIDYTRLCGAIANTTAAVYMENPNYFGILESDGDRIAELAHKNGAEFIVCVDPISLGVITPPVDYGADIVCGDIQSLGMHMNSGGGHAGFIACPDEEKYLLQFPSRLFEITTTSENGEYGFNNISFEQTSLAKREDGNEWVGTGSALWGITAGVYLALMGPKGMYSIGENILAHTRYAMKKIGQIPKLRIPYGNVPHFREFIIDFSGTGKSVKQINQILLANGIFGGKDLSSQYPYLDQSALFCITETHNKSDIDALVEELRKAVK